MGRVCGVHVLWMLVCGAGVGAHESVRAGDGQEHHRAAVAVRGRDAEAELEDQEGGKQGGGQREGGEQEREEGGGEE
eukprot:1298961-Rhodomonas_salina.2